MIKTTIPVQCPSEAPKNSELVKLNLNIGASVRESTPTYRSENLGIDENLKQKEGKILPVCYRCTKVPKEGLYDGFRIQGMFFCSECQQELFSAEPGSPEYQEFMFLIKGIFY